MLWGASWPAHFRGRHVLITGASEGVGLELAKQLVPAGARVSLLSRSEAKLRAAEAAALAAAAAAASASAQGASSGGGETAVVPADVTDESAVAAAVAAAVEAFGEVGVLMCCAGAAECGYFHTTDAAAHRRMMDLNYMGVVHAVRAVLPAMVARRSGHLVAVASTLSLMGSIGYCAYAPSKFAVRGLMESLRNELQGTCVNVTICYPPDMDTPGYARENEDKPIETREVSGNDAAFPPDRVARCILSAVAANRWVVRNPRADVQLLQDLTLGLVPRRLASLLWVMVQCFLGPVICWAIAAQFDGIARRHAATRYAALWGGGGSGGSGKGGSSSGSKAGGRPKKS